MQLLLMAEIVMKKVMKCFFFQHCFPPSNFKYLYHCMWHLIKKNIVLLKKVFSIQIFRQKRRIGPELAMIRNFPSEIFSTGKLQFFQKVSIYLQKNQNESSLPRLLSSNLFSHCREEGNWRELCRLVSREKLFSDDRDISSF